MTKADIRDFVISVDPACAHYDSAQRRSDAYSVWWEKRLLPFMGDNAHEIGWSFQIDYFTKVENDPMAQKWYDALTAAPGIAFEYLVDYERETGFIHHIFDCEGV